MIKFLMFWMIGMVITWIILAIHDILVTKYQPEEKLDTKEYQRAAILVLILSLIPLVNYVIFIMFIINIARFKIPKEEPE